MFPIEIPGQDKAEELKSKRLERDNLRAGRMFLAGQMVAIVAYFLVNVLSFEVDQGEEEDGVAGEEDDDDEMDE